MIKICIKFNLQNVRKLKRVSQAKLARKTNLSQSYISQLEREVTSPTLKVLGKIAKVLHVLPADLVIVDKSKFLLLISFILFL